MDKKLVLKLLVETEERGLVANEVQQVELTESELIVLLAQAGYIKPVRNLSVTETSWLVTPSTT